MLHAFIFKFGVSDPRPGTAILWEPFKALFGGLFKGASPNPQKQSWYIWILKFYLFIIFALVYIFYHTFVGRLFFVFNIIICFLLFPVADAGELLPFFLMGSFVIGISFLIIFIAHIPFLSSLLKEVIGAQTYSLYIGENPAGEQKIIMGALIIGSFALGTALQVTDMCLQPSIQQVTEDAGKATEIYVESCKAVGQPPNIEVIGKIISERHNQNTGTLGHSLYRVLGFQK